MTEKKLSNKVIQTFHYDQKMVPVPIFAINHFYQIINLMKKNPNQITKGRGYREEVACLFSIFK